MNEQNTSNENAIEKKTSFVPVSFKWGLIGAMLYIIYSMTEYYINGGKMSAKNNSLQTLISFAIAFFVIYMAIKEVREKLTGGYLLFNQGFKTGFQVSLFSAIFMVIYCFVLFNYIIDPDALSSAIIDESIKKMKEQGNSDKEIEIASSYIRKFTSPGMMITFATFFNFIYYIIVSLITAAILKKDKPQSTI